MLALALMTPLLDPTPPAQVPVMRSHPLIVALPLVLMLGASVVANGCISGSGVSNPTPHPGTEDPTGIGTTGSGGGGMMGDEADPQAEPNDRDRGNGAAADAGAAPDPMESDAEQEPGPDCEALAADLEGSLADLQSCEVDEDCALLVDDNDCDCTRAIAVAEADLSAAQALLDLAMSCTDDEDDVLGGCIADAPPTGNMAACEQSVCVAYMPGGSCLAPFGEDAETSQGADIQSDEDAGPDTQNAPSYDVSE